MTLQNTNFPDIAGSFQQGYRFGAQQKALRRQEKDDATMRNLAPAAIGGDLDAQAQAMAIDPARGEQYTKASENIFDKMAGGAAFLLEAVDRNADPKEIQGRYQAVLPLLARVGATQGKTPSPTFDPNQLPAMRQLVWMRNFRNAASGTAEQQNFAAMTAGFTPEQIKMAQEIRAGIRARAGGELVDVPDGKGGSIQMIYDAGSRTFSRPNYGGQAQPMQGQPQREEGQGVPSQIRAAGGVHDDKTPIHYNGASSLMNDAANQTQASVATPGNFGAFRDAVEWQESRWNPNAVSSAGAVGRMQTMPGTLADPGFGVNPARDQSDAERTRVGNDYLQAMFSKYGDPRLALAAYNAGPGRVDQAMQASGGNVDRAISMLPKETQDYIPSVMGRAGASATGSPIAMADAQTVAQLGYKPPTNKDNLPSGYRQRADGTGLEPIPGGPADKSGANGTPNFDDEQKLRKEFTDYAKNDRTILGMYDKVKTAATQPSAANDLALIFAYMKMLDPGSVVREQEFANAQNAGGVPDRVRAAYNKVLNGERLSDSQRSDFLQSADGLAQTARQSITQSTQKYQGIADASGFDAARATGMADFRGVSAQTLPGASQGAGQPVQVRSEADYNALPSGAMYVAPDGSQRRKR